MKIGIDAFVFQYPLTGVGTYTFQLIKELLKSYPEHEYILFLEKEKFDFPEFETIQKKAKLEFLDSELFGSRPLINRYINAFNRRILAKIFPRTNLFDLRFPRMNSKLQKATANLDIFHSIDWYVYPSKHSKKNIVTIFDLVSELYPEFQEKICIQKDNLKRKFMKNYDKILAISESTKNDIVHYYNADPSKIEVTYLGTDEIFEKKSYIPKEILKKKYGIPENPEYILSVSTIEPRKNFMQVLKTFQLFRDRYPKRDIYLVATGQCGWKQEGLKKILDNHPFRDKIIFTGYSPLEDLPSLYHHASVFLYLSHYEGFGLPILEAMKSGTPVISSNTSSMPEVLGGAGELVSPDNTEEIVHAMEKILLNENHAKALIKKGLKRSELFSWEKTAKQVIKVYGS